MTGPELGIKKSKKFWDSDMVHFLRWNQIENTFWEYLTFK